MRVESIARQTEPRESEILCSNLALELSSLNV